MYKQVNKCLLDVFILQSTLECPATDLHSGSPMDSNNPVPPAELGQGDPSTGAAAPEGSATSTGPQQEINRDTVTVSYSTAGIFCLHPRALLPAQHTCVTVYVKCSFRPGCPWTWNVCQQKRHQRSDGFVRYNEVTVWFLCVLRVM